MIDKNRMLNEFHRLFAKTCGTMYLDDIAECIRFAILKIPYLLKAYPDDEDLPWMVRSFMRRAFRNTIRIIAGVTCDKATENVSDDLAQKAGIHQYLDGKIVSLFRCMEKDHDDLINEDFKFTDEQ